MKKLSLILLAFALVLSVTACGGRGANGPSQTGSAETTDMGNEALENPSSEAASGSHTESPSTENEEDEPAESSTSSSDAVVPEQESESEESAEMGTDLRMMIGDNTVAVQWVENEAVDALIELVKDGPLTVQMSMYGGFEQVGSLGTSLPRNDVQTTTRAGDIVLYSGNQIVVFYGSNSWAYTRLGRITDKTAEELAGLLGNGNVVITITGE